MDDIDVRSPLPVLPNISHVPGRRMRLPNLFTNFKRGRIDEILTDSTNRPNMTFRVTPVSGDGVPGDNSFVATMLQAGCSNLTDTSFAPGGIIYMPTVGSYVLMAFDRHHWCILGFYSGPISGPLEIQDDPQSQLVSFNCGLETAQNRLITPPGFDIPWLFDLQPGDTAISQGFSKIKVTSRGIILSTTPVGGLIVLGTDGEIQERFSEKEEFGLGYWKRLHYKRGTETKSATQEQYKNQKPLDGSFYKCEIVEATIYSLSLQPYVLKQSGHISRSFVNHGRSSIYAEETAATIKKEAQDGNYAIMRNAVIQPAKPDANVSQPDTAAVKAAQQALEVSTKGTSFETYDFQVDPDGSFRLRGGNTTKTKGGQNATPTQALDISLEYKASTAALTMRVGRQGSDVTHLNMSALDEHTAKVDLLTTNATINCRDSANITAIQQLNLTSNNIALNCNKLTVTGAAQLQGNVETRGNLTVDGLAVAADFIKSAPPPNSGTGNALGVSPANRFFLTGVEATDSATDSIERKKRVGISVLSSLSVLAGLRGAVFLDTLQGLLTTQGAALPQSMQGVGALQCLSAMQGTKGISAVSFLNSLITSLTAMQTASTLGTNGTFALSFLNSLNSLPSVTGTGPGGLAEFVNLPNLSALNTTSGQTFITALFNLLTGINAANALSYLSNISTSLGLNGLLDTPGGGADGLIAGLMNIQNTFTTAFNVGGAAAMNALIADLGDMLTLPQIVGLEGQNALNGLTTALTSLRS